MNEDLISRKYVIAQLLKEREQFPPMVAERYSFGVKLPHMFNQAMRGGIRKGLRIVETAPAVDAEPVRHGRWYQKRISVPKGKGQTYLVWACSLCHKHEKKRSDYCPNCGAEMDAEVEG